MEPFKNMINKKSVDTLATHIAADAPFDHDQFRKQAKRGLDKLELKERGRHIATALDDAFDCNYPTAIDYVSADFDDDVVDTLEVSSGMSLWPFLAFIEMFGVDHWAPSMRAMKKLTGYFSAEFAIRPFIETYQDRTLAELTSWAEHPSPHVRRLVSEGSRPLLPWGMRLHAIKDDPHLTLPLLEALKDDPSEYVRRSVSNHLNDHSKHHPELVIEVANEWWSEDPVRQKTVKHALRTLLKKGNPDALSVLGFSKPKFDGELKLQTTRTKIGGSVEFSVVLNAKKRQKWMIDYAVHHVKANGSTTPKVFKWTTRSVEKSDVVEIDRKHAMKPVTTRKYYSGTHAIEVFVNGVSIGKETFEFVAD